MSTITLTYFDFAGSRGEECRLALHLAGVPFTDDRLSRAAFDARKTSTPFGALPVLTIEGQPPLGQTNPILRYLGNAHDLHPTDAFTAAREEAIMESVEDMRDRMGPLARIKDEAEKKRAREEAASGFLQEWAGFLERQLGDGPFVGGASIHVADLKIFVALGPFQKGKIDHVSPDVFKAFPKLLRVYEAVASHPKILDWYRQRG